MLQTPVLHERLERSDAQRIAGLAGQFEPATYPEVGNMWKRFSAQLGFPGQLGGGETIGVFRNRDVARQSFEHLAGVWIISDAHMPLAFKVWDLPPQAYLVFRQMLSKDPLHLQVMAAQTQIGELIAGAGYERLRAPDLQVYPANFKLGDGGWLEHWIPGRRLNLRASALTPSAKDFWMTDTTLPPVFKTDEGRARFMEAYDALVRDWPVPHEELDIETRLGPTHVIASGAKDAPALFLLHSMAGTATSWRSNVAALSRHFRVYAADTPGQVGKSIATQRIRTRQQMADWFTDLLDKLGHRSASIAGCSHGGFLAMSQAALTPDRVDKVVLISPAGTFVPLSLGFIFAMMVKAPLRRLTQKKRKRDIAHMLGSGGPIDPGWRKLMAITLEASGRPTLASPLVLARAELAAIRTPVLLLIGDGERLYDPARTIELAKQRVPGLAGEVIPNAHHIGAMAQPELVNARMLDFLRPG